jgi:hypothetical protein
MGWQYRPPSPDVEASNTLSNYEARLRAAESRDRLDVNLVTEPPGVSRVKAERLRTVGFLWSVGVLAIAGAATWFLDPVLAAETVAVFTAIVIFTALPRMRRASDRDAAH